MSKAIKSAQEILLIEKACNLADKAMAFILKEIKEGVTEKKIRFKIVTFIKNNNSGISFRPIVAFGENAADPHHVTTLRKLKKGDFVMLDLGAKPNGYCSDITRTFFFGKPTDTQKRIYETVLVSQQKAIEYITSNLSLLTSKPIRLKMYDVDKAARDYIKIQDFEPMPHSLGHGIGQKVHENFRLSPKSKKILKPGMVFSIEPAIYIKGFGGVRIEDTVVLEEKGLRILTCFPKELTIL